MPAQRHIRLTQRVRSGVLGQVGRRNRPLPPTRLSPISIHSTSDSSSQDSQQSSEPGDLQRMLDLMRDSEGLATLISNRDPPNREHFEHLANINAHCNTLREALTTTCRYVDRVTNYMLFLERNLRHVADTFEENQRHLAFMLLHMDPFEPAPVPPPESLSPRPISPIFQPVLDPLRILDEYSSSPIPSPLLPAIPINSDDHRDYRTVSERELIDMGHSDWVATVLRTILDGEDSPVDVFRFNRIRRQFADEIWLAEEDN